MEFLEGSPEIEVPEVGRWTIDAAQGRTDAIDRALDALEARFEFGDRDRFVARLCLDEAITNACEHGGVTAERPVEVFLHADPPQWVLRVRDRGEGYDPEALEKSEPDPYDHRGRGLPILDGYSERMVVADRGREVTVWVAVQAEEPTA